MDSMRSEGSTIRFLLLLFKEQIKNRFKKNWAYNNDESRNVRLPHWMSVLVCPRCDEQVQIDPTHSGRRWLHPVNQLGLLAALSSFTQQR